MSTISKVTKMIARQMPDGLVCTIPSNKVQRRAAEKAKEVLCKNIP